jgi:hypothetical protein
MQYILLALIRYFLQQHDLHELLLPPIVPHPMTYYQSAVSMLPTS